jgi:hypothetical protein
MIPRLGAEETLAVAEAVALGSGTMNAGARRRRVNELKRIAGARRAPPADPRALAMMGIAVEVVPPAARDGEATHG